MTRGLLTIAAFFGCGRKRSEDAALDDAAEPQARSRSRVRRRGDGDDPRGAGRGRTAGTPLKRRSNSSVRRTCAALLATEDLLSTWRTDEVFCLRTVSLWDSGA